LANGTPIESPSRGVAFVMRQRRRQTYLVWLVLFHPSASDELRQQWHDWTVALDKNRRPISADLLLNIPLDLRTLNLSAIEMRKKGWVWIGVIKWRDRRDVQRGLEAILDGLPTAHDARWIWMHVMEGDQLVYTGTAVGLDAASFAWRC
jgi:hypothetical protein